MRSRSINLLKNGLKYTCSYAVFAHMFNERKRRNKYIENVYNNAVKHAIKNKKIH